MAHVNVFKKAMLSAQIATGAGTPVLNTIGMKTYSASGSTTAGTGAATIVVEGSMNGGASYDSQIGTISLTLGTTVTSDGFQSNDCYELVRMRVTSISGTGASVDGAVGY